MGVSVAHRGVKVNLAWVWCPISSDMIASEVLGMAAPDYDFSCLEADSDCSEDSSLVSIRAGKCIFSN